MKRLTVHNVDDRLHAALKREAQQRGMSLNRYVLQVLAEAAEGGTTSMHSQIYHDLDHLAGTWTPEQAAEFSRFLEGQRQLDEALWT